MGKKERLCFDDLQEDVIDRGICDMCRGCVSFCSADSLHALTIKDNKPAYLNQEACLKCGICYMICPNTDVLDTALMKKYDYELPIGQYKSVDSLRTTSYRVRDVCTDGGVVTSFLQYLLDSGYIDGAVISRKDGHWNNQPMIATGLDDLIAGAGTSMAVSPSVEDLGGFTTYVPMMLAIRSLRASDMTRVAFVGTPCQIQTLRKMQILQIVPAHVVKFTIGLFCYENFNFTSEGMKALEKEIKMPLSNVTKINVKQDFIVRLNDESTVNIDLDKMGTMVRSECIPCIDFSNYSSDLSVGGLGSADGYTTVISRSHLASSLLDKAISMNYIERNTGINVAEAVKEIEGMAMRKYNRGVKKRRQLGIIN